MHENFSFDFSSQNIKTTNNRKTATFFTFLLLFLQVFATSCVSAGPEGFPGPAHVNPSGPTYVNFHCGFLWRLRGRDFPVLLRTIMRKQSCEEFVNVFNSSILYCLTADSKRMEYSVNVTKMVQLQSFISDFWSIVCRLSANFYL